MMKYLLDTNIISDIVKFPRGSVAKKVRQIGADNIMTSVIVCAELRFGYKKSGSQRLKRDYEVFFSGIQIEDWCAPLDETYSDIRKAVEASGKAVGAMDLLIAAQAIALDATLVTGNEREFSYVPGLKIENWLK